MHWHYSQQVDEDLGVDIPFPWIQDEELVAGGLVAVEIREMGRWDVTDYTVNVDPGAFFTVRACIVILDATRVTRLAVAISRPQPECSRSTSRIALRLCTLRQRRLRLRVWHLGRGQLRSEFARWASGT